MKRILIFIMLKIVEIGSAGVLFALLWWPVTWVFDLIFKNCPIYVHVIGLLLSVLYLVVMTIYWTKPFLTANWKASGKILKDIQK